MIFRAAWACRAMTKNKLLVSNQICHKKIYITVIDSAVKLFQAVILQVDLGSKRHALDFSVHPASAYFQFQPTRTYLVWLCSN